MSSKTPSLWTPLRAAGLAQVSAFSGAMGRHYAAQRNTDFGPDDRSNTSTLSPYLRRRLIVEHEVIAEALDAHTLEGSEKFVQEVFWRTYFKGWLERRPSVWTAYNDLHAIERRRLDNDAALSDAMSGKTGIDCFDAWAQELVETNYLHNHARMWFASIWIFTLELPWVLGAEFFMRHLLDGDPASNTLSWRWVAGLHTRGKNYAAAPWNIAKFTNGRFAPDARDLAQDPEPLSEAFDYGDALPVRDHLAYDASKSSGLLITVEDCLPEMLGLSLDAMASTATAQISPSGASDAVRNFDTASLADAAARAQQTGAPPATQIDVENPESLSAWATASGITQIVTAFVPTGPTRDWLDQATPALDQAGITLSEIPRQWDVTVCPLATAGFFKIKKKIPLLIDDLYT